MGFRGKSGASGCSKPKCWCKCGVDGLRLPFRCLSAVLNKRLWTPLLRTPSIQNCPIKPHSRFDRIQINHLSKATMCKFRSLSSFAPHQQLIGMPKRLTFAVQLRHAAAKRAYFQSLSVNHEPGLVVSVSPRFWVCGHCPASHSAVQSGHPQTRRETPRRFQIDPLCALPMRDCVSKSPD